MRCLAKCGPEEPMEMKFRKTSRTRRVLEQNPGLVFGGQQVASAAEPAEGVVMEKVRHAGMILPANKRTNSGMRLRPRGGSEQPVPQRRVPITSVP
jgi:hypothetical protein